MMRRIQSEKVKPAGPQRISIPEALQRKRRGSEGNGGWAKNLIRRASKTSGEPGKRASNIDSESFVANSSDEESSEEGYGRFDVGCYSNDFKEVSSQQSNYAPTRRKRSLESTTASVLYHSSNAGTTDDSFNEDLTREFACMRDRIVDSHIKSVHRLVAEKSRLQKELSQRRSRSKEIAAVPSDEAKRVPCRKEHDDLGRSKAVHLSLTREGQDPVGLAVPSSPRTKSETSSTPESQWGSRLESERTSRLQSPQNSRPPSRRPSRPQSAHSEQASHSRHKGRRSGSEASQEPVQSDSSNGTKCYTAMHDAPPLLTEPEAGTSLVINGEKAPDVASGLSVRRRPPMPPEGTPEPPANLPSVLPGLELGDNELEGFADIRGVMAIASLQSVGPMEGIGSLQTIVSVGEKTEDKLEDGNGSLHNESERTFDADTQSSSDSSQHPEEKFELWGIWMKNSRAPATRRQSITSKNKETPFGDRSSLDPYGGDRSSQNRVSDDGVTQNMSGSFLASMVPSMPQDEVQSSRGSRSAKIRRWLSRRLILTPSSLKHVLWEIIGLQLIVYDAILIPLHTFDLPSSPILTAIAFFICVFRSVDLLKKFLTGFVRNEGTIELDPIKVARRYVKSWLVLDAACTICDWISLFKSDAATILEMARMFRMLRLISAAPELERLVTEHMMSLGHADIVNLTSSVVKSIILLLAVAHFVACAWYAFGRMALDAEGTSWVQQLEEGATLWERYAWSLHWSLGQFVGELIFLPTCGLERSFALAVLFFALLFSALFVSTITTAMTRLQILAGKQASQMAVLRRYLSDHDISASLTVRVLRNAEHSCHSTKRNVPEKRIEMLNIISEPLRVELNYEVHFPILAVHPWFERYQTVNPAGLRKVCHVAVKIQPLQRGDVVFCDCETPVWPRMFFVVSGRFAYMHETHAEKLLTHGDWASEAVLWTRWMHCGTLTAGADGVLASLDAEKFTSIVSPFPTPHAIIYGQRFVHDLNNIDRHLITDLASDRTEQLADQAFRSVSAVRGKDNAIRASFLTLRHSATTMLSTVPNIRNSTGSRHQAQAAQASRHSKQSRTSNYSNSPVRRLKSETAGLWESEA